MSQTTAPPIANGSFVSWNGGKGRVDLIVSTGKVPGVEDDVEGSTKTPAARVVVWENGKPTRKKIGVSTHTLRRIPPIRAEGKAADPVAALVEILADHEEHVEVTGLPASHRVTGRAVKAAYDRGLTAWPGEGVTTLSRTEWALGRVGYLVKAATGLVETPGNDVDLLPPDHPLRRLGEDPPDPALADLPPDVVPLDDTSTLTADPDATPSTDEPAGDQPQQQPDQQQPAEQPDQQPQEQPQQPEQQPDQQPGQGGGGVENPDAPPGNDPNTAATPGSEDAEAPGADGTKVLTHEQIEADLARLLAAVD